MIFLWKPKDFLFGGNQKKSKGSRKDIQRNPKGNPKKSDDNP